MRGLEPVFPSGIRTILHWSSSRRFHDIAPCSRTQENGLPRSHTVYSKRQCMVADLLRRASDVNPHATITIQKIPRKIPHTIPTQRDETDTRGRRIHKSQDHYDTTRPLQQFAATS